MRFLVVNHDHPEFQKWFYSKLTEAESKSYNELLQLRHDSLFGLAAFYSSNLRKLGHEAWDIRVNDEILQKAWARENGAAVESETEARRAARGFVERFRRLGAHPAARHFKPLLSPVVRRFSGDRGMYAILRAHETPE